MDGKSKFVKILSIIAIANFIVMTFAQCEKSHDENVKSENQLLDTCMKSLSKINQRLNENLIFTYIKFDFAAARFDAGNGVSRDSVLIEDAEVVFNASKNVRASVNGMNNPKNFNIKLFEAEVNNYFKILKEIILKYPNSEMHFEKIEQVKNSIFEFSLDRNQSNLFYLELELVILNLYEMESLSVNILTNYLKY